MWPVGKILKSNQMLLLFVRLSSRPWAPGLNSNWSRYRYANPVPTSLSHSLLGSRSKREFRSYGMRNGRVYARSTKHQTDDSYITELCV